MQEFTSRNDDYNEKMKPFKKIKLELKEEIEKVTKVNIHILEILKQI